MPQRRQQLKEAQIQKAALAELASHEGITLGSLITQLSSRERLPKSTVARALSLLLDEGEMKLENSRPHGSLLQDFYSLRNLSFWVLVSIPLITGLTILGSSISPFVTYVRWVFGFLTTLLLPGYGLVQALYPRKELPRLNALVYSVALSLALIPLVGVFLNYSPWRISLDTVFVSFLLIDVLVLFAGSIRRLEAMGS